MSVRLDRLPRAQDGFRIVQLTDIHVGPTIGRAFVEEIVGRTNALAPDLVAITGDLVDGTVGQLAAAIEPLARLQAPHGVYFVTGNHEYFSGAEDWLNELNRLGIRVLRNERVSIDNGTVGFDLAGVDDRSAVHYGGLSPEEALGRALLDRDPGRELVLLAHQPRTLLDAEPFGIGLQLSGHTHGGQMWPFNFVVGLQQPFVAGLHRRGKRADLRQPWHRLLGTSHAARRAGRDHRDSAGERAGRNGARLISLRTAGGRGPASRPAAAARVRRPEGRRWTEGRSDWPPRARNR